MWKVPVEMGVAGHSHPEPEVDEVSGKKMGGNPEAFPRVTVGVLSWNRLHYLRATLESARTCIRYPNLEWIVSDNESSETGLQEYLESLDWVDVRIVRRQTHADAMNEIVARASGEYLLIWPDDMQFTVVGEWMADLVEVLRAHRWLGTIGLGSLRRLTCRRLFTLRRFGMWRTLWSDFRRYGLRIRRQRIVRSCGGFGLRSLGWCWPGVVGSGIPTIARKEVWETLGPWRSKSQEQAPIIDSSLGAEDDMVSRFYESGRLLQHATPLLPVAADIVTDPTGTKAKVRDGKRYGVYMAPPDGTFYYQIQQQEKCDLSPRRRIPLGFEECVTPLGFSLPFDGQGNLLKSAVLNMSVVAEI